MENRHVRKYRCLFSSVPSWRASPPVNSGSLVGHDTHGDFGAEHLKIDG
jgi:hypothetical protein